MDLENLFGGEGAGTIRTMIVMAGCTRSARLDIPGSTSSGVAEVALIIELVIKYYFS